MIRRLRDMGINIASHPAGVHNAISDVPGVWVGHKTLLYDRPRADRSRCTTIG